MTRSEPESREPRNKFDFALLPASTTLARLTSFPRPRWLANGSKKSAFACRPHHPAKTNIMERKSSSRMRQDGGSLSSSYLKHRMFKSRWKCKTWDSVYNGWPALPSWESFRRLPSAGQAFDCFALLELAPRPKEAFFEIEYPLSKTFLDGSMIIPRICEISFIDIFPLFCSLTRQPFWFLLSSGAPDISLWFLPLTPWLLPCPLVDFWGPC